MRASKTFKIVTLTSSSDEAHTLIREGKVRVGVVIPPKFHDRKLRGDGAELLVLIDGSDSTVSSQAAGVDQRPDRPGQILPAATTSTISAGLSAHPIILFNPEGRTANYIIPGLIAVLLMMVGVVLSAGAIVREREQGTFEQLLVTPINPIGLVMGKLMPYLVFGLIETALVLLLMRFAFAVPIRGSLVFLFVSAIIYLFPLLSIGLLISTRAQTQMESQQMAQSLLLPAIFLSGYIFPFDGLPRWLQAIGYVFPTTYMIRIMRGIVLRGASPL